MLKVMRIQRHACGAWYLESQDKVRSNDFVDFLVDIVSNTLKQDFCKVGLHAALDDVVDVNYYKITKKYNFEQYPAFMRLEQFPSWSFLARGCRVGSTHTSRAEGPRAAGEPPYDVRGPHATSTRQKTPAWELF